ncbi:MAG: hypothetical protein FWH27_05270, partial [Planctomycetaceae bacterium]|nr:hypothetical protein [Planctomycetaceae bacterium]
PPGAGGGWWVSPDTPPRDIPPWERQPNSATSVAMASNNPPFPPYVGTPQTALQNGNVYETWTPNMPSPNGQNQPVPQANDYGYSQNTAGMANGSLQFNSGAYPNAGVTSSTPQQSQQQYGSASQQIADGFGAMPQQVPYPQSPANHGIAVAANTNAMPSYSQVQGQSQWQEQSQYSGYPQYAGTQNPGGYGNDASPNQQQPYPGNGSQYGTQGTMQFVPQSGMSNVPVATSSQSYRDAPAMGSNLIHPYPGNPSQQQPLPYNNVPSLPYNNTPYNNTAASQAQSLYH